MHGDDNYMNYKEAIQYIEYTAKFSSKLGLERTEAILKLLGDPHKRIKCIHVAGTNGKGSVTAMVTNILMESGYRVGMYTSPYLMEFEERIQVNGENISKENLAECISKTAKVISKVISMGYGNPTQFEIITCAAFLYFYEQNVDFAVIEVGLGGRLDSTNVITPIVSAITSISYDHMQILGNTLSKIAYEKAGIIKYGIPTVLYPMEKEALDVIEEVCQKKHSKAVHVYKDCVKFIDCSEALYGRQHFKISTKKDVYDVHLSLLGKHQLYNSAVAVKICEELIEEGVRIKKSDILNGLSTVKWPGRLEIINDNPLVVIDGAHNVDGIRMLSKNINDYFKFNNIILILGILKDKQVDEMIKIIVPKAKKIFVVTPNSTRGESAEKLKDKILYYNADCEAIDSYEDAYCRAEKCSQKDDIILICGSLYMVGDMRKMILSRKTSGK